MNMSENPQNVSVSFAGRTARSACLLKGKKKHFPFRSILGFSLVPKEKIALRRMSVLLLWGFFWFGVGWFFLIVVVPALKGQQV